MSAIAYKHAFIAMEYASLSMVHAIKQRSNGKRTQGQYAEAVREICEHCALCDSKHINYICYIIPMRRILHFLSSLELTLSQKRHALEALIIGLRHQYKLKSSESMRLNGFPFQRQKTFV